jgi:hypothetical protein
MILSLRGCEEYRPEARADAEKVAKVLNWLREVTGIYSLGFRKESFAGLMLPILFILIVGGIGAALIFFL